MNSGAYGPTPLYISSNAAAFGAHKDKMYETQILEMNMQEERGSNGSDELSPDDGIYTVSGPNG